MTFYRLLLHLYPAAFRNEYGPEMARVFQVRHAEASSSLGRLWIWLEALPDLFFGALREHIDILRQDVRYAWRAFLRSPLFAFTAILVIALGVGANTAIFSVVDVALIRPLPFRDPDRLVKVWEDYSHFGYSRMETSLPNFIDWKHFNHSFESLAAFRGAWLNLTGSGAPERLEGAAVSADLFPMLGASPFLGRAFTAEEEPDTSSPVLVLSYGLWQRRFGGDPGILGRKLVMDGAPWQVIGVMPESFRFPQADIQFWMPLRYPNDELSQRDNHYYAVLARLRKGVTLDRARADMSLIATHLEAAYPKENAHAGARVNSLRDEISENSRLLLLVLLAAAGAVLMIGCANLANLLLARANARRKELAVRAMLGAGAERLRRQVLTESVLLSFTGGLLGILIALWSLPVVSNLVPAALPIDEAVHIDTRVLIFALALSLLTGIGFGSLPAWQASREGLSGSAKEGGRDGVGGRRGAFRSALVIGEVSISVVLLVCAGLLIHALSRIQDREPGFQSRGVLTLRTYLPRPKYDQLAQRREFYQRVIYTVNAMPGVQGAAYVSFLPFTMRGGVFPVLVNGKVKTDAQSYAMLREATPDYFRVMGIPLLAGRDISEKDNLNSLKVAVVSASFAPQFLAGRDPIGQHFQFLDEDRTIVGVAGEVLLRGLERTSEPQIYLPYGQFDADYPNYAPKDLVIRATVNPASLIASVRRAIWNVDPDQPISNVRALTDVVDGETSGRRGQLRLLVLFTGLSYFLAALGIYGVLSFLAGQRTQEIGVRMALGARRTDILWLILGRGLVLSGVGLALGLIGAAFAARAIQSLLFGVNPADPLAFLSGAGLCLAASVAAAVIPATRAAGIDPVSAIRCEN